MIAIGDHLRRRLLFIRQQRDRRTVLVAAGDHKDMVALHAVIAGKDIGGEQ